MTRNLLDIKMSAFEYTQVMGMAMKTALVNEDRDSITTISTIQNNNKDNADISDYVKRAREQISKGGEIPVV